MIDPQLAYDASQMALLLEHPAWEVLRRHVGYNHDLAMANLRDHRRTMEEVRFSQGAVSAIDGMLSLPDKIIYMERESRK